MHPAEDPSLTHPNHIDILVEQINAQVRQSALRLALVVGELIIEGLYQGDLAAWRDRGVKDTSFNKLAARPDLKLSAPVLYRAAAIYEMSRRIDLHRLDRLGVSHLRAVLGLPDVQQQALLEKAQAEGWTVIQLTSHCQEVRGRSGPKRGRPRQPEVIKRLSRLNRLIHALTQEQIPANLLGEYPLEKVKDLLDESERQLERLRQICQILDEQICSYSEE